MCCLQILRLKGYKKLLEETPDVSIILSEHMRIRSQLLTISHRFRIFMVSSLFTISFSQMCSLFVILGSAKSINFFRAGDLAVMIKEYSETLKTPESLERVHSTMSRKEYSRI
jgi:hypothetical protein